MPKTLIFTKLDGEADRILDELGRRTGLACRDGNDRRIFDFEGAPGDIDAIAEVEAIDAAWAEPVRLESKPERPRSAEGRLPPTSATSASTRTSTRCPPGSRPSAAASA